SARSCLRTSSSGLGWCAGARAGVSPYGEGIAFWALGEIVKAECGILESDSPEGALTKLDQAIPQHEPDRAWLKARLAPPVGAGEGEPATLVAVLLKRTVLPAAIQQRLLDRAGGNPLYAEEFVRLLSDRDLLAGPLEEVLLPDSVQALIAARLDTLSAELKSLLQDAAVSGKVFWAGALASMGERDPRDVELALHELARKELVRPTRSSSMQGEQEYGFWHLI